MRATATTCRSSRARSRPPDDAERIRDIRARSRRLIAIGACATAGRHPGAAQLRRRRRLRLARLREPRVHLDAARLDAGRRARRGRLRAQGCPPDKGQLLEVISAYLNERRPAIGAHSVCVECKRRGNVCVMVAHGTPCLGPVTHAGCGALCPSYHRGCYGCFGPMEAPNTGSLGGWLARARPARARRRAAVPHVLRRGAGVSRGERGSRWLSARSSPRRSPASKARARCTSACATGGSRTCACASTSRRASSRPSCADGASPRSRTSPRGSAASARSPTRSSSIAAMEDACGVLGARERARAAARCCTAASGSRATRCTCSCSTRRTSSATRARSRWPATTAGSSSGRWRLKKAGNALMRVIGGREIHPVNVRVGGFYRAPTRAELAPVVEELEAAREFAREAVAWTAVAAVPRLRGGLRLRRAARRGPLRDRGRAGWCRAPASTSRSAAYRARTSSRSRCRTPPRCTRACATGRRYLVGPLARYALNRDRAVPRSRARRPTPRASRRCAATRSAASSCARSRSSTRSTRRCGCSRATSRPTRRPWASSRARPWASAGREAPRGPALAPLRDRRRRHDPRRADRAADLAEPGPHRAEPARVRPAPRRTSATTSCDMRCEQAVRSYDPCISCATHFLRLEIDRA